MSDINVDELSKLLKDAKPRVRQLKRLPEIIKEEDFLKISNDSKVRRHHKLAYGLGFYQCMRVSEVVNLQPGNVHLDRNIIEIRLGKGGKDRNIPLSPEVKAFRGFVNLLPLKCGVRALEISFKKDCKRILGKDLHFHSLRHSGATHYLNVKKWNLRQLQIFLGHSRLDTTEIYTHVTPEDLLSVMWGEK
jgi:integrase